MMRVWASGGWLSCGLGCGSWIWAGLDVEVEDAALRGNSCWLAAGDV